MRKKYAKGNTNVLNKAHRQVFTIFTESPNVRNIPYNITYQQKTLGMFYQRF